jgi:hypothetical protein
MEFPDKRVRDCFTWLQLSAGKLPQSALMQMIVTPSDENSPGIIHHHSRRHMQIFITCRVLR